MMWPHGVDGSGWFWVGSMMLLFWGGVVLLAIWAIRATTGYGQTSDTALEVLRRRLAAGEISPEEFEKIKKALGA